MFSVCCDNSKVQKIAVFKRNTIFAFEPKNEFLLLIADYCLQCNLLQLNAKYYLVRQGSVQGY